MPQIDQNDQIDGIEKIDGIEVISRRGRQHSSKQCPKQAANQKAAVNIENSSKLGRAHLPGVAESAKLLSLVWIGVHGLV